jgi:hypothetical protein
MRQFKKFTEVIEIDDASHRNSIAMGLRALRRIGCPAPITTVTAGSYAAALTNSL